MLHGIKNLIGATILIVIGATVAGAQEDCRRGALDAAYCDRNGDLVADAPADPKRLVNPPTLVFAYTPED